MNPQPAWHFAGPSVPALSGQPVTDLDELLEDSALTWDLCGA